jgi:hypothetical protein
MYPIASLSTSSSSVLDFTSISQTFTHLQARVFARSTVSATTDSFGFYFNNDTTSGNYWLHELYGNGASTYSDGTSNNQVTTYNNRLAGGTSTANIFTSYIIDILDYTNTNKNKTVRIIGGTDFNGSGTVGLNSALWLSTAAINRITFDIGANFAAGSTIQLYGISTSTATGA